MKYLKYLPVFSLVLTVAFSVCAVTALGVPNNISSAVSGAPTSSSSSGVHVASAESSAPSRAQMTVIGVAKAQRNTPDLDMDKIERIINANRVFDSFVYDTEARIDEAQFVLINEAQTVNGVTVIRRETVDSFIAELYGREVTHTDDSEYYTVSDRGFTALSQRIVSADEANDGTVTVYSRMTCDGDGGEVAVTTVLSPANTRFGYIIRSAEIAQ